MRLFWKAVAIVWDMRCRKLPVEYSTYPIASTEIKDEYEYPEGVRVLYEWDEKGLHWIVFSR